MNFSLGLANFIAAMPMFWKIIGMIVGAVLAIILLCLCWKYAIRYPVCWLWNQFCWPFRFVRRLLAYCFPKLARLASRVALLLGNGARLLWATGVPENILYVCLILAALGGLAFGLRAWFMDMALPEYRISRYSGIVVGGLIFGVLGIPMAFFGLKARKMWQRLGASVLAVPVSGFIIAPLFILALAAAASG